MNFIDQVKNFIFWGWKMRNTVDFDLHSIYHVIYLKLDTTYKNMVENSHLMWNRNENTKGMKKMRVARILAKRLHEHIYLDNHYDSKDDKSDILGDLIPKGLAYNHGGNSKRYRSQIKEEKELLFELLEKHIDQWWD